MAIRLSLFALVAALGMGSPRDAPPADGVMPTGPDAFAAGATVARPAMIEVVDLGGLASPPAADAAFDGVMTEVTAAFAADVAATTEASPDLAGDDLDPALSEVPGYGASAEVSSAGASPAFSRLAEAVRLTGPAADAWADLAR